jgi:hypothetical protein
MPNAPNGHRVEIVHYQALPNQRGAEYVAVCADCRWMWMSRGSRQRAEQDVEHHDQTAVSEGLNKDVERHDQDGSP